LLVNEDLAFWIRADLEVPVFTGDEVRRLPATTRRLLESRSLIRPSENLQVIECDACGEGHVEEVVILTEPTGSQPRAYISCPEAGRVSVDLESLQQWSVDLDVVARTVATALDLCDRIVSIRPGRVWLLGTRKLDGRTRDVFFVRGITWPDSRQLLESAARLASSSCPVILCLNRFPNDPEWQNRERVVFSLAEPSWLGGEQTVLLDRITAVLRENSGPRGSDRLSKQAKRGKTRSAWLDLRRSQRQWTSDLEIESDGGPTYNTIQRYRSGRESTRDAYVRGRLAKVFGVRVEEVPD
jgi:hypothetical protein